MRSRVAEMVETNTKRRTLCFCAASSSARVPSTLTRRTCRSFATPVAQARWTIASMPWAARSSESESSRSPLKGSTWGRAARPSAWRARARTSWPLAASRAMSACPMNPDAPVTSTFMIGERLARTRVGDPGNARARAERILRQRRGLPGAESGRQSTRAGRTPANDACPNFRRRVPLRRLPAQADDRLAVDADLESVQVLMHGPEIGALEPESGALPVEPGARAGHEPPAAGVGARDVEIVIGRGRAQSQLGAECSPRARGPVADQDRVGFVPVLVTIASMTRETGAGDRGGARRGPHPDSGG